MNTFQILTTVAAVIGSIGAIVTFTSTIIKRFTTNIVLPALKQDKELNDVETREYREYCKNKFESIDTDINELALLLLRLQILDNIHHTPTKLDAIYQDFQRYTDLGGNGYVALAVEEWRKKYAKAEMDKRIDSTS